MSEAIHMAGCPCPDCMRGREATRDNPSLDPAGWVEREKKAGRGRFDVRHVGKDKEPHAANDPHFRIVDRLANKTMRMPLRTDEQGNVVAGCDPISGTVGDLVPAIKELQESFVYRPLDDRFDLVEDVDQDPKKDQSRSRWGLYDRAAGALVVPRNKKGEVLAGFKSEGAARRWLSVNRRSISKFGCPTTPKGLKHLKQRIEANSPEGKRAKEVEKARQRAMKLLKEAKRTSQDYQYATEVLKAIESGQPIPERPKKIKPPKAEAGKPAPGPAPAPEPERFRGRVEIGGAAPTNGRQATPATPSTQTPPAFRVRAPSEPPPAQPSPPEPERFRGRVMNNPDMTGIESRLKKVEHHVATLQEDQNKIIGTVSDLGKGIRRLEDKTVRALGIMGATKNVMKAFESGKSEAKPKTSSKGKAKPKAKGRTKAKGRR